MKDETRDQLQGFFEDFVENTMNSASRQNMDDMTDIVFKILEKSHRTLQQLFWNFIRQLAVKYAEGINTDARNEASKEFTEMIKNSGVYLPLI